jgi:phosphoribosylglycinamide formyltransferase 1
MHIYQPSPDRRMRLAVLLSGTGRSLKNMLDLRDAGRLPIDVVLVVSSTPSARGLQFANEAGITQAVFQTSDFALRADFSRAVFDAVRQSGADLVALAGFLKQLDIPDDFANRVLNIHPALIPSFCGKGFYGHHVHEAALAYGVKLSGCTVHFVDNQYDHGPVLLQKAVPVAEDDTPESLADRVFAAECEAFPEALHLIAEGRVSIENRRVRIAASART